MASSSSSSLSTSVSLYQSWNYDVFLSFRGEDTRKTFVDHLYAALDQQGIYTYKDDETLCHGESIGSSLLKAIEESQIAVVVFSKSYADSSWCLDELAHVMKCREERGQIVMPIFYDVEPSEVRKQEGKFGEGFSKHELGKNKKVESWRKALVDVGNISGWEPKHIANGHESKCIKEIVETISHRLHPIISGVDENLIGIEARVQNLKSKLQIGADSVLMIGIWGVGGGGKTTLASSVYDDISSHFDGCCFVENIRENSCKDGLKKLQEKILRGVLKLKEVNVDRVEEGRRLIKSRLFHKVVLIVLDDVDDCKQLEALAGSHEWFGKGSRIIITTRDVHLLNAHNVNVIHDVSLLNKDEATQLFSKHAPQNYRPVEDYKMLSQHMISYAGGLPLALKVLGRFLCDKDMDEWRSAVARLKEIPDSDIMEKLKISYDGLTSVEKDLFLDIACFFRRTYINEAMEIFDACGYHPVISIKVLAQKALITVSKSGWIDMHDLMQEMGHYIVRGKHPKNPQKYTRVWEEEDVRKLCVMGASMEVDKIEAIRVYSPRNDPLLRHFHQVIANMKKLRWIHWVGVSESSLPKKFPPPELHYLRLVDSRQRQLWQGYKYLPNLRIIKLYELWFLIKTPDFNGLPNLERFALDRCWCLKEIHSSIEGLERLIYLKVSFCDALEIFLSNITAMKKLETLQLSSCRKLFKNWINEVALSNSSVTCLPRCGNNYRKGIMNHVGLQFISTDLTKLNLNYCDLGDEDMDSGVWDLPNLQELILRQNDFTRLPSCLLQHPRLKWLDVSWCRSLVELAELPPNIAVLGAGRCDSLETVGDISNNKWLWKASLWGNNKLGPYGADIVLDSMLQGNAIGEHFISFHCSQLHIPKRLVDRLVKGKKFKLKLPNNWYHDFSGFLICNANRCFTCPSFTITMKKEADNDSRSIVWLKSNDKLPEHLDTYVGYVSVNSLMMHAACSNPSYNIISFSIEDYHLPHPAAESWFVAELVPRKGKGDHALQTTKVATDCSEFYDKEDEDGGRPFTIQQHSKSSMTILWRPY